ILAGFQKDVRPWLVASDIFVFPSYREGFPNVVMQASLLRVPCVATDIIGSNEIIRNNFSGMLIPPKKVVDLMIAMEVMMSDSHERQQYASNARDYVYANFRRQQIWEAIYDEYNMFLMRVKSRNKNLLNVL